MPKKMTAFKHRGKKIERIVYNEKRTMVLHNDMPANKKQRTLYTSTPPTPYDHKEEQWDTAVIDNGDKCDTNDGW